MSFDEKLVQQTAAALESVGIPPATLLVNYVALLMEWNEKINLTGAKTPEEFVLKHVADVWGALRALGESSTEVFDVGSGGGIPGIVLGIMMPEMRVTLVERRQKKAAVLSSVISKLGLDRQVRVIAKSFEEIGSYDKSAEYWFRGFLPGPKLATYLSEAFPKADLGRLILMKGPAWQSEKLEIMSLPKVKQNWVERFGSAAEVNYALPRDAGERVLALI